MIGEVFLWAVGLAGLALVGYGLGREHERSAHLLERDALNERVEQAEAHAAEAEARAQQAVEDDAHNRALMDQHLGHVFELMPENVQRHVDHGLRLLYGTGPEPSEAAVAADPDRPTAA